MKEEKSHNYRDMAFQSAPCEQFSKLPEPLILNTLQLSPESL
jgi:hypothetical protein